MYDIWEPLGEIAAAFEKGAPADGVGGWSGRLAAAAEAAADALAGATAEELRRGAEVAKLAHDRVLAATSAGRGDPAYMAGRAAALTDLLAYAAAITASSELERIAKRQPFASILEALAAKALNNTELATLLRKSEAHICRSLGELRRLGAVSPQVRGREVFNILTPIGRSFVEEGIEVAPKARLSTSNVEQLGAWNLADRAPPVADNDAADELVDLPRISAA